MGVRIDSYNPLREGLAHKVVDGSRVVLEFYYIVGNSWYRVRVKPTWIHDAYTGDDGMPITVERLPPHCVA